MIDCVRFVIKGGAVVFYKREDMIVYGEHVSLSKVSVPRVWVLVAAQWSQFRHGAYSNSEQSRQLYLVTKKVSLRSCKSGFKVGHRWMTNGDLKEPSEDVTIC